MDSSPKSSSLELLKTIVLGAGYAGINAYYELRRKGIDAQIISDTPLFLYKSAWLRKKIFKSSSDDSFILPRFVRIDKIKEIDLQSRIIITENGRYEADNLIIALGAERKGIDSFMEQLLKKDRVSIGAAYSYDEYMAIQIAFYLNAVGKKVSYSGSYMSWLGAEIQRKLKLLADRQGIESATAAEYILPPPEPPPPLDSFCRVDRYLSLSDGVYAAGDVVEGSPKVGELAMRMGIYAAKRIAGKDEPFKPIFVNIIDTGKGKGIHIRSDHPWQGEVQTARISRLRWVIKRFLEKYYFYRKGNMGFLIHL